MADHPNLTGASLHEPKGVASANSGEVYVANGSGSGVWTDLTTAAKGFDTYVVVKSASDFPTPVSDIITLAADTVYILDGDIDIGDDKIVFSNNSAIRGLGGQVSTLTTTTTGVVFTASSVNFHLDSFQLTATTGTVFALTGGATESAYIRNFTVLSASSMGTVTAWYSFVWEQGAMVSFTTKLTFAGACNILIMDLVEAITGYTTAVDLGAATFNTLTFFRCGFSYASATNHINIAANGANLNSGKVGRIVLCSFDTGATNVVNNYVSGDEEWFVIQNKGLDDSTKNAQAYMHTTTTTTISGGSGDSGNPIVVNGATNWVDSHSDQFTITTGGRLTYTGLNDAEFDVTCNISGTAASGTQTFNHYIAKNGTTITASKTQREYASTAVGSPAPCHAIVSLSTNDYIELFVENTTGTNDWDSYILNMIVRGA